MANEQTLAVIDLVDAANEARRRTGTPTVGRDAEGRLESLFRTSERLAVYGSLAPGRQNHHIVAPLGGTWTEGVVEGDLFRHESGPAAGFSGLRLRSGGPTVAVHLLTSPRLPGAWRDLDAFEGPEYRRVLAPVWSANEGGVRRLLAVANLYESAEPD